MMKKGLLTMRYTKGLSLIELLVAMVLGLTVTAGVIQIYVDSTVSERDREARQRIQEGGRFATSFLSQEIRMAGYLGCLGSLEGLSINSTLDGAPASFQPQFGVQGWEAGGTNPATINNSADGVATVSTAGGEWTNAATGHVIPTIQAVPNSDILRVWGAEGTGGAVTAITEGTPTTIQLESDIGASADDFLIISDCEQADFVQACTVVADAGPATTSTVTLATSCNPGNDATSILSSDTTFGSTEAMRLQGTIFYVGKRSDTATNPPSLFRRQLSSTGTAGAAEELIEGVESMQILYGINVDQDTRSTVDAYIPADAVTNFQQVISVRISLLMQSVEDGTVPFPQEYIFDGITYDGAVGNGALPTDNRVRRVFVSTISLRNRALGT